MRGLCVLVVLGGLGGCTSDVGGGATSISIEPAATAIEILNGAIVTADFHAVAHHVDGTTTMLDSATWRVNDPRVGAIDASGHYTPTGELGGVIEISGEALALRGTTTLTVKLHIVDGAGALDSTTRDALVHASTGLSPQHASQDPAIAWAYPYDGTVFPRGLDAPPLMWNGGIAGDWYYVHLTSATFELEAFHRLMGNPNQPIPQSRYSIPSARWNQLVDSTDGAVDVAIARLSNAATTGVVHHQWTIAPARLPGTIYYWTSLTETGSPAGRMRALDLGARAAVDFLADYQPTGGEGCPKCHTPSADGRHMVLVMGNPFPNEESVNYDLATGTTTYAGMPSQGAWGGAALSPHGDVLVESFAGIRGRLGLGVTSGAFDPTTGAAIADTGLESVRPWMPTFSPDGRMLVYVDETMTPGGCQFGSGQGATDGPLLKACSSDLRAVDWDPVARRASHDRLLVSKGADPAVEVLQYPTASPDHGVVIYGRGSEIGSFSHISQLLHVAGGLYTVRPDAPEREVELAELGGRNYPFAAGNRDRGLDYEPSFAPVTAGGYAWVVFVSRRTYGNVLTGPSFVGEGLGGVKQMWIAAIDPNAAPGADPSHPAFWLPGQDISPTNAVVINQRARWTLSPCIGDGCITLP